MADGILKVGTITTSSGSGTVTLGQSGETINIGATSITDFKSTGIDDNASSTSMTIDSSGRLLVGTTTADGQITVDYQSPNNGAKFNITNSSSASNVLVFNNTNGTVGYVQTNGSSTSYNTSSDYRLKKNLVDIEDATSRLKQLKPKRFNFIADADTTVDGFLAHEVQTVVPEAITGTKDAVDEDGNPEYQGIDQSKLVPILTKALQEAVTKIEELETRIQTLENN